jgi:ribonuclease HII
MTRPTRREENKLFKKGFRLIAGTDEAGRGAWAGPLVAAAVILPRRFSLPGINDSKKLSPRRREQLFEKIIAIAISWQAVIVSREEIDARGIGRINLEALRQSVLLLPVQPDVVLVDSFHITRTVIPHYSFDKGDARIVSIAAASIIAKVTRDRIMTGYHKKFPHYQFHRHKGYGTPEHHRQIKKHGLSPLHRRSFEPMKSMVSH